MKKRKLVMWMLFAFITILLSNPVMIYAVPVYVPMDAVGTIVTISDGPGSPGGEFIVNSWAGKFPSFLTFCVEYNEYINFVTQYTIDSIVPYAVAGGVSGSVPAIGGDPLSPQTAYLFTQFSNDSLSNYFHDADHANALQAAIWWFEGEGPLPSAGHALEWVNAANAAVDNGSWSGLGNVQVLNINYNGTRAQSQLVMVPEPATLLLLGAGLLGLGIFGRKKVKKIKE